MSKPLYSFVRNVLGNKLAKKGAEWQQLVMCWQHILGQELGSVSYPGKIVERGTERILEVLVQKPYVVMVGFSSESILGRINDHFGWEFLNKLKIVSVELDVERGKNAT